MNAPVAKAATVVPLHSIVRGVAGSKLFQRKTFAVVVAVSKYLGASAPVIPEDTGHIARLSSLS